jgi:hypothetical protein
LFTIDEVIGLSVPHQACSTFLLARQVASGAFVYKNSEQSVNEENDVGRVTRILFIAALIVLTACLVVGTRTFVWHGIDYEFAPKWINVQH